MATHLRGKKIRQKRKKRFVVLLCVFLLALILLICATAWLSRLKYININQVEVFGNHFVSEDIILEKVEEKIGGNYVWGLWPKRNILFFPKQEIFNELNQNPRISNAYVRRDSLSSISIEIKERDPYVLSCVNQTDCYFVDETGFIYSHSPIFSDDVYLKIFAPDLNLEVGNFLLETETFQNAMSFVEALRDVSIFHSIPRIITILDDTLEVEFENGMRIIFQKEQKSEDLIKNLSIILSKESFSKFKDEGATLPSERILFIDYIDMRFGNKIFYKVLDKE